MGRLIDACKAIDAINEECDNLEKMRGGIVYAQGLRGAIPILDTIPSAEPERKTGKWMLFENQRQEDIDNGNYMYTCSNCLHFDIHAKIVKVPYCWFCGANMED